MDTKQFALEQAVKFWQGKSNSTEIVLSTANSFYNWLNK